MCIYPFITLVSGFVYFGRAGSLGVSSGGPGHIFFLRGSAVWNVGPVQFIWALAWGGWRGSTGFSSLWLCCGEYGTIHLSAGRGWAAGLYSFFSFSGIICQPCVYKLLILFVFITGGGGRVRTRRAMSPCWSKRSWSIEGWNWRPVLRSTSLMCGV